MAEINNAQAVRFANEKARVMADRLARAYYDAKAFGDEWYALNLGSLFPSGKDIVLDGADKDGRPQITADNVLLLVTRCTELVADYEANNKAKLNTILAVAVNPQRG